METDLTASRNSSSVISLSWSPVIIWLLLEMPISLAMAEAVVPLSPVIMTTRIPARLQTAISSFTPARGGSVRPTNPSRVNEQSVMEAGMPASLSGLAVAMAMTRKPCLESSVFFCSASARCSSVRLQTVKIRSGLLW